MLNLDAMQYRYCIIVEMLATEYDIASEVVTNGL